MGKQTAVLVGDTAVSTNAESRALRNGVAGHLTGEASESPQGCQSLVTENNWDLQQLSQGGGVWHPGRTSTQAHLPLIPFSREVTVCEKKER